MKKLFLPLVALAFWTMNVQAAENQTYQLSTHILDISLGKPAAGVNVVLSKLDKNSLDWQEIDSGVTDKNGRIADFLPEGSNNNGTYKLTFKTYDYFKSQDLESIYPYVDVVFKINGDTHYHIPITMSANGYATYRGN